MTRQRPIHSTRRHLARLLGKGLLDLLSLALLGASVTALIWLAYAASYNPPPTITQ